MFANDVQTFGICKLYKVDAFILWLFLLCVQQRLEPEFS